MIDGTFAATALLVTVLHKCEQARDPMRVGSAEPWSERSMPAVHSGVATRNTLDAGSVGVFISFRAVDRPDLPRGDGFPPSSLNICADARI